MELVMPMNYELLEQEEMMHLDGGFKKSVKWLIGEATSVVFGAAVGLSVKKIVQLKGLIPAIKPAGAWEIRIFYSRQASAFVNFAVGLAVVSASAAAIGYGIYLASR